MLIDELGYLLQRAATGWLDSRVRAALLSWTLAFALVLLGAGALVWLATRRRSRRAPVIAGLAAFGAMAALVSASDRTESLVRRDVEEVLRVPANATSAVLALGRARGLLESRPALAVEGRPSMDAVSLEAWLAQPSHAALLDTSQPSGEALADRARAEWRGAGLSLVFGGPPGRARSPTVGWLDAGSAEIVWEAVEPGTSAIRVVSADGTTDRVIRDARPHRVHRVVVDGLQPLTRYEVHLEPDGAPVGSHLHFTTLPARGAVDELRLAVLGDSGDGSNVTARLVAEIRAFRPSLVLHVGDLAYPRATPTNLSDRFHDPLDRLLRETWVWAVPGNHDVCDGAWSWREFFGADPRPAEAPSDPWLASLESAGARIVAFNSNAPPLPGGNARRVLRAVLGADARWKIVFFHHPVISHGREAGQPVVRALIAPLLVEAHVDLAFSGHAHNYQRCSTFDGGRRTADGVRYVVSGGGGDDLDPTAAVAGCVGASRPHFVRIRIRGERLWLEAVDVDGPILDRLALAKAGAVALEVPWSDPPPAAAD